MSSGTVESSSRPRIPKKPPVSAESLRSSLLQHFKRYGTIVHGDGTDELTPEEVQAQRDAGVPEEVIQKIYFSKPDPKEQKSKAHVIQQLVLEDLDRLLTEINGVNKKKEIQGRLTGIVGLILTGITFLALRKRLGIYLGLKSALRVLESGSIRHIVTRTINKLYAQSPVFWFMASIASVTGYFLVRDTKSWIAVDSVGDALVNMRERVDRFKRVPESDVKIITGWRWESVPWRDPMREQSSAGYGVVKG